VMKSVGAGDDLLQRARLALYDGSDLPSDLRRTVSQSWMRSRLASVRPDRIDLPYLPVDGAGDRLLRAATPVLERFAEQLNGTGVSIVLADPEARVIGRWSGDEAALSHMSAVSIDVGFLLNEDVAGTNGIGTVLEDLTPLVIHGAEHYAEPLRDLVCVGVPIHNPITRRLVGVLDLACPTALANGLLLPTALSLSTQIESELASHMSRRETAVFAEFMARCRETSVPVIALSEQFMLTNAAAANILDATDQALFWDQAAEAFGDGHAVTRQFRLGSGAEVLARCNPIRVGKISVGALIEVAHPESGSTPRRRVIAVGGTSSPRSHAAIDMYRRVADPAMATAKRIRVEGEAGTGKLALIGHLTSAATDDGPLTILRCASTPTQGADVWMADLASRVANPTGTLVIRNFELLPSDLAEAVVDLLDAASDPPRTVMTVTSSADGVTTPATDKFGGAVIRVPALRERREDIPDIVHETLRQPGSGGNRVGQRAMAALVGYRWPGNLRQLSAVVTAAGDVAGEAAIELEHLPEEFRAGSLRRRPLGRLQELERDAIAQALRQSNGNKIQTAKALGLSRSTLYRRLRYFGLDEDRAVL